MNPDKIYFGVWRGEQIVFIPRSIYSPAVEHSLDTPTHTWMYTKDARETIPHVVGMSRRGRVLIENNRPRVIAQHFKITLRRLK